MKPNRTNNRKVISISLLIIILIAISAIYFFKSTNNQNSSIDQLGSLNKNLGPELEKIPNNTVIIMSVKDTFTLPTNYLFDSQIVDKSILVYPKNQKNIEYNGLSSLESLKGIFITSANSVKNEEQFNKTNQEQFDLFKKTNPTSDATSQMAKDKKGNPIFKIQQSKPFKMVETILNKEYIIEVASFKETAAFQKIVDSYGASELISENDHKAIVKLHKNLIESYFEHNGQKLFSLLSTEAQKNNPIEKIKKSVESDVFKDMISLEPTALFYFNGNFILQSKVLFNDNFMSRVDLSLKVDYDGKTNSWAIDSYTIKNKEKYLSSFELK